MVGILGFKTLCAQPANQPKPVTLYYNGAMELTTPEKALFRRETLLDFENITFSGVCKDYKTDKLISEKFYEHGVNTGLHTEYSLDGKVKSTLEHSDQGFIIWELRSEKGDPIVTQGTGNFTISCFVVESAGSGVSLKTATVSGRFERGRRTGTWTYTDQNNAVTDTELYEAGEFVSRTDYSLGKIAVRTKKNIIIALEDLLAETFQFEEGTFINLQEYFGKYVTPLPASYNRSITFPGGMKKLLLIIALGLQTEVEENQVVKLTVDENGKYQKIKANFLLGSGFTGELASIVKPHETKLLPAIRNGKPVSMTIKIPVGNSREWIDYLQSVPDDDVNAYLDQLNPEE